MADQAMKDLCGYSFHFKAKKGKALSPSEMSHDLTEKNFPPQMIAPTV
jgi:hypothetical protein